MLLDARAVGGRSEACALTGGISDACERCPVALKKERGRELQLLILYVLRIYIHKFLEIMGVLLNMFYLDEYISFLTIVCGSFCGSLEYIVCLGTACENMATVLKEISTASILMDECIIS